MILLNEKYYNILNQLHNKSLLFKNISHDDFVVLHECGYLRSDIPGIISSKGLLALDEYRSQREEKNKSSKILKISIASLITAILSLIIGFCMLFKK